MTVIILLSFITLVNRIKTSRDLFVSSLTKETKLMIQISLDSIDQQTINMNPNM
ncbi:hypothetical protein VCRA2123O443_10646 [Vibrio crassostreae]|nr:hypothetical protein VCRA2110O182_10173 [Vibrio crassostreae]CAK2300331.1 hypothetical protein VCRA2111O408_10699 [Vibrio crassostreae]CAK2301636.1 hypothetical protein VCRA211O406_10173 [Vibrio crassostreae]CAK3201390.1 hypothetical protein VCRA2123O443_10646 [Vibrio crassostreae]